MELALCGLSYRQGNRGLGVRESLGPGVLVQAKSEEMRKTTMLSPSYPMMQPLFVAPFYSGGN